MSQAVRRTAFGLAAAWALVANGSEAQIFVPNAFADAVTVYEYTAAGNDPPLRTIQGPNTGIDLPFALAVDNEAGELFVASFSSDTVLVYPLAANGNVVPIRTKATQSPIGMHVDSRHGELFVRNFGTQAVSVFKLVGEAPPHRILGGPATTIDDNAVDLFVDTLNDELVIANRSSEDPSEILFFARTASGDVPPQRAISGPSTGLLAPYSIYVDAVHDEIFVGDSDSAVRVFDRRASGDVAPLRTLELASGLVSGVFVDLAHDELFLGIRDNPPGNQRLAVYDREAAGAAQPLRVIAGSATGLDYPSILELRSRQVFADGFETGNTSAWSLVVEEVTTDKEVEGSGTDEGPRG